MLLLTKFAAAEGIDNGKMVKQVFSELLNAAIKLQLCVDYKDIFSSLSKHRNKLDQSVR